MPVIEIGPQYPPSQHFQLRIIGAHRPFPLDFELYVNKLRGAERSRKQHGEPVP
jgi:hypothetical protein